MNPVPQRRSNSPHPMGGRAWLLLLALALCWGGSFFFAEVALEELPPSAVAWGRVASGALFLLLMLRAAGLRLPRDRRAWGRYAAMGLLNNALPFALIFQGQAAIGAAAAAILNAATPCFTVVLAHWLTDDERLSCRRAAGAAIGALGVALLIGLEALDGLGSNLVPALLVLSGALSYAFAGLYGRRFRREPPLLTAAGQVVSSTLWLLPLLLLEAPWRLEAPGARTLLALAGLGLISTALAYRLYFRLLALAGASNLLLVTLLIPPAAMLLSFAVLGQVPRDSALAGFAVIALGLAVLDGRLPGLRRRGARRSPLAAHLPRCGGSDGARATAAPATTASPRRTDPSRSAPGA